MTSKTITNTNCPIPGEGGFDPAGSVVFKVVIRATFPPGQALALGPGLDDRSFPVSLFKLYRSSPRHLPLL
jgi:hypothetical protein